MRALLSSFGFMRRVPAGRGPLRSCRARSALVMACMLCAGCGNEKELGSIDAARLEAIARIYLDFVAATGRGPVNETELVQHRQNMPDFVITPENAPPSVLEFVSERDGQPFVIRYGRRIGAISSGELPTLIAWEQSGKAGRRLAVNLRGEVECLDEQSWQARRGEVP